MAKKKKKKISQRNWKRFLITISIMIILGIIRTYYAFTGQYAWFNDLIQYTVVIMFIPLLNFILNDILRLDVL